MTATKNAFYQITLTRERYDVTFPLFEKTDVNGPGTQLLYQHLERETRGVLQLVESGDRRVPRQPECVNALAITHPKHTPGALGPPAYAEVVTHSPTRDGGEGRQIRSSRTATVAMLPASVPYDPLGRVARFRPFPSVTVWRCVVTRSPHLLATSDGALD